MSSQAGGDAAAIPNWDVAPLFSRYPDALPFLVPERATRKGVVFYNDLAAPRKRSATRRITGCERMIHRMTEFAKAILVPESETSRRAVAGAWRTDND